MRIAIERATEADARLLGNLLQFYLYDFSPYDDEECDVDEHGVIQTRIDLRHYLSNPRGRAYLVRVDDHTAGFALVEQTVMAAHGEGWRMDEFHIMLRYRRQGVGRYVAHWLFGALPGRWEVGELRSNTPAIAFWRRVIDEYTGGRYSEQGADDPAWPGPVQIFRSPTGA